MPKFKESTGFKMKGSTLYGKSPFKQVKKDTKDRPDPTFEGTDEYRKEKDIPATDSNVNIEAGLDNMNFYALNGHAQSADLLGVGDLTTEIKNINIANICKYIINEIVETYEIIEVKAEFLVK